MLHVRGETPEEILALLTLTGVEFELLDAGDQLPRLREVAQRLLRAVE